MTGLQRCAHGSYTGASFASKNVGTVKPVLVSGITISGTDAGNYTVNTTASSTADITAKTLTVSATGINKVYDGTTTATVTCPIIAFPAMCSRTATPVPALPTRTRHRTSRYS